MARKRYGNSFVEIDISGPFFEKGIRTTYYENTRQLMEVIASEGERATRSLTPRRTGFTQEGIQGRVNSLDGKRWYLTAVISQTRIFPWRNKGTRGYVGRGEAEYRGGKLEAKFHMFRRTTQALRAKRKDIVDLVKGLN